MLEIVKHACSAWGSVGACCTACGDGDAAAVVEGVGGVEEAVVEGAVVGGWVKRWDGGVGG